MNIICILLTIILLQYFRYVQRKLNIDCDVADVSVSDYTIMISRIPKYLLYFWIIFLFILREYDAINDDYDDDLKYFLE